jgi:hypothetical protein
VNFLRETPPGFIGMVNGWLSRDPQKSEARRHPPLRTPIALMTEDAHFRRRALTSKSALSPSEAAWSGVKSPPRRYAAAAWVCGKTRREVQLKLG